ncbi:7-carboxy-7-deazaguanine synthase [Sneathiella chinensis]|uniref:7-carboxy-7-deazaguanine synthase n=1 Tax=Sneathiella chinensis TaxID=349750 RepID=A0ABQ5U884_9PROT|nr:7-carboxy-7-deazaguanine synthase [Sneathiella chinensis]GLQ07405.1 7-carboxy-7-deazaguanine synthase [Sneathiella chinensis]
MTYSVKEMFLTLQGEGAQSGRAAVFLRFSGCNLWTGREQDRETAACRFCDTDFVGTDGVGGGKFKTADLLADAVLEKWPGGGKPYVVCTGGEPLLQLDAPLIDALHQRGFEVAVETNGSLPVPDSIDWICVSPKGATPLKQTFGDELKLVFPQAEPEADPERFAGLDFTHFYLQPKDIPSRPEQALEHTRMTEKYCLSHPRWKLSVQTHKLVGFP